MFDIVLAFCLLLSSAPLFLCFPLQKTQDVMLPKFIILAVERCYFQLFIILRYYCIPYSCLYASGCFDVLQQPCLVSIMYACSTQLILYFLDPCMLSEIDAFRLSCSLVLCMYFVVIVACIFLYFCTSIFSCLAFPFFILVLLFCDHNDCDTLSITTVIIILIYYCRYNENQFDILYVIGKDCYVLYFYYYFLDNNKLIVLLAFVLPLLLLLFFYCLTTLLLVLNNNVQFDIYTKYVEVMYYLIFIIVILIIINLL